jgi:hypothetical protein
MQETDISAMVVGSAPTVFNPNHWRVPTPLEETAQLQTASESGNIFNVQKLVSSERLTKDHLAYALTLAGQNGHTDVVSYLLSIGVSVQPFHVENAIRTSNNDLLRLFLTNGCEINKPINWTTPSLLMYVLFPPQ